MTDAPGTEWIAGKAWVPTARLRYSKPGRQIVEGVGVFPTSDEGWTWSKPEWPRMLAPETPNGPLLARPTHSGLHGGGCAS